MRQNKWEEMWLEAERRVERAKERWTAAVNTQWAIWEKWKEAERVGRHTDERLTEEEALTICTSLRRPAWCPHPSCRFVRSAGEKMCVGKVPQPESHGGIWNDERLCLNPFFTSAKDVIEIVIYEGDRKWLRWLFDALDEAGRGAD